MLPSASSVARRFLQIGSQHGVPPIVYLIWHWDTILQWVNQKAHKAFLIKRTHVSWHFVDGYKVSWYQPILCHPPNPWKNVPARVHFILNGSFTLSTRDMTTISMWSLESWRSNHLWMSEPSYSVILQAWELTWLGFKRVNPSTLQPLALTLCASTILVWSSSCLVPKHITPSINPATKLLLSSYHATLHTGTETMHVSWYLN